MTEHNGILSFILVRVNVIKYRLLSAGGQSFDICTIGKVVLFCKYFHHCMIPRILRYLYVCMWPNQGISHGDTWLIRRWIVIWPLTARRHRPNLCNCAVSPARLMHLIADTDHDIKHISNSKGSENDEEEHSHLSFQEKHILPNQAPRLYYKCYDFHLVFVQSHCIFRANIRLVSVTTF